MRKLFYLSLILLLCSHDLYLKMEHYFLQPNEEATLSLYNGTFEKSENIITRDRMLDASFLAQGERVAIRPEQWKDQDSTITALTFNTGAPGTYVAGVSTKARNITLTAEKFNSYLEHDGVLDVLEQRKTDSVLDQDAVESYEKHVKAIYQVGERKTNDWQTALGYPIEFVPQANPSEKYSGEKLSLQLLLEGKPLTNQLVYADYLERHHDHHHGDDHHHDRSHDHHHHDHGHDDSSHGHTHDAKESELHTHTSGQQLRTDDQGMVSIKLPADGIYYVRTIYMTPVSDHEELTHQSKWATLTFEVRHQHGAHTHTHDHHEEERGLSTWIFIVGSILIVGLLFLFFRKKKS